MNLIYLIVSRASECISPFSPSVRLYLSVSVRLSFSVFLLLVFDLSACLSVRPSVCLSVYLSAWLCVFVSVCSNCLCVLVCVCLAGRGRALPLVSSFSGISFCQPQHFRGLSEVIAQISILFI